MTPEDLEGAVMQVAEECDAECSVIAGEDLLAKITPAVCTVGRALRLRHD